jgi:hypothetical protein
VWPTYPLLVGHSRPYIYISAVSSLRLSTTCRSNPPDLSLSTPLASIAGSGRPSLSTGGRIPAPLQKEDRRVLAYYHVPPCGKGSTKPAGFWAHGAADQAYPPLLPAPGSEGSGGWRRMTLDGRGLVHCAPPTSPPPLHRRDLQPCAGSEGRGKRWGRRPSPWTGPGRILEESAVVPELPQS